MKIIGIMALMLIFSFSAFSQAFYQDIENQLEGTATVTSTLIVPYNSFRKYLLIQNKGAVDIYAKFKTAQTGVEGIKIVAGGNYEPYLAPKDKLYLETASGTSAYVVVEGVSR